MGGQCPTDDSCHTHPPAYTAGSVGVPCTRRTHHTHTRPPTTWQTQTHCIAMHVTCRSAGPGETANAPPLRAAGGHATQAASSTASPRHRHTHTPSPLLLLLLLLFSSSLHHSHALVHPLPPPHRRQTPAKAGAAALCPRAAILHAGRRPHDPPPSPWPPRVRFSWQRP
ncbi:hypothetical protein COCCADRAFT_94074 [Bipolaris zeicola 26-R-13]|uniref:Uncharacterized protein n=1 Tax=Cochliobolus carbonum (strain 26-R-13) TaxID=930089 RepID=W6Y9L7_COCC2|nr:uncharacterized protein COCCADRAFT_94074 [Bipolaris zeicola 26-R-13]EUC34205.1 hypothetical protein COCCADRAFT_94074 [Bipolaris zeicola 26-R-13]